MNRFAGCILESLTVFAVLASAPASDLARAEGGPDRITAGLSGGYEGSRILENAGHIEVTMMRPATSVAPFGEIQYLVATYPGRDGNIADFDALVPDDHVGHGSWQIVVRTPDTIHWLRGHCEITADQFRGLYAGAVEHANHGGPVETAWLCQCATSCRRVAVNR